MREPADLSAESDKATIDSHSILMMILILTAGSVTGSEIACCSAFAVAAVDCVEATEAFDSEVEVEEEEEEEEEESADDSFESLAAGLVDLEAPRFVSSSGRLRLSTSM